MTKHNLMTRSALIALTLHLGACATMSQKFTPENDIRTEVALLDAPQTYAFATAATDQALAGGWNTVLKDQRLNALIDIALKNNPSLRASAESVARSNALLKQSRSSLLPSLTASASASGSGALEDNDFSDSYSAGLSASWEADLWGGIQAGILASGYDLYSTRATYESARQALIASVARTYILGIEADQQIKLSEQTLAAQQETLRIVNVRYELGATSRRELVLAESDVASAQDTLVVARSTKTDAVLALQILIAEYPDGNLELADDFPTLPETYNIGTPDELVRRRPDVIAAEYDVLSAFETTRTTVANRWPSLFLSSGLNTSALNLGDLLDPVSIAYSLGAQLADTLFDGGLTQARIDAATARQKQALATYGQTVLDAYFDVESTLNTLNVLKERTVYVEKSANAAQQTLALAEIQYKEGEIDLLDVLTFRQRSFQADQTRIGLERQSIAARIALYLALGDGEFTKANFEASPSF